MAGQGAGKAEGGRRRTEDRGLLRFHIVPKADLSVRKEEITAKTFNSAGLHATREDTGILAEKIDGFEF
jgi:hypothetical protein